MWKTEEPGVLQSMGSERIRHDSATEQQAGTCQLRLQKLNYVLLQLLVFNTPWKELRMESGNKALCAGGGETGKTHLQIARDFQESIYERDSCITSYLGKHQNPSWWWFSFMHSRSFWKNMCLTACTLPSPKSHIYCSSPSTCSEQFLRAIWGSVSWGAVFILPQIKLNLQLSRCGHFFKVDSSWKCFYIYENIIFALIFTSA